MSPIPAHIGMRFHPLIPALAVVFLLVAWMAYRRTTPGISTVLRATLTAMRSAAFLLIIFLLLDPRNVTTFSREQKARVIALVDRSASMSLPAESAEGESRLDRARGFLNRLENDVGRAGGELDVLWFASDVRGAAADTVRALGQGTDISGALAEAAGRYEGEPLAGVVLVSDGVDTGEGLTRPSLPDVPVFTVGVGDTVRPDDARIEDVDYSSVVRVPSRTTVTASVMYSGDRARRATVRLLEGKRVVFRADTILSPAVRRVEQGIPVRFRTSGRRAFTLRVDLSGGDAQPANDSREIVIEGEKASTRVVVVDMTPEWELNFLADHLRRDETFDFDVVTRERPDGAAGGHVHPAGDFIGRLSESDAVIVRSVNAEFCTDGNLAAIERFVRDRGGGLLVLPGDGSLYENADAWNRLAPLLPVRGKAPMRFRVRYTRVIPGATAGANPVTSSIVPLLTQTGWQDRSPLLGYYTGLRPRAGAQMLMGIRGGQAPAVVYGTTGRGRVAVVCAGPLWRWRFLSDDNGVYDEFVGRLLDVLSRGEESGRFVVSAGRNVYETGVSPEFTAELFNDRMQPVTGVPVRLEIVRVGDDGTETPLSSHVMSREGAQSTRFVASVPSLTPGNYIARGRTEDRGRPVTSRPWKFRVSETSVEFKRVYQDRDELVSLARRTGGVYANASVSGIAARMKLEPRSVDVLQETILRSRPGLFLAIVLLLGGEWFLRKRAGMI